MRPGEHCKIPGVGPLAPGVARDIAGDAFVTGVLFDGKDLRHMRRWTRNIPVEVTAALELGRPPEFDGVKCVDCGRRFRSEKDHLEPHSAFGPASTDNLEWRCYSSHSTKTERDRKAGKLRPRRSGAERAATGSSRSPRHDCRKSQLVARRSKAPVRAEYQEIALSARSSTAKRGPPGR